MPCGGIFPITNTFFDGCARVPKCWHCNQNDPPPDHMLVEWDSFLHGKCIEDFLKTEEGEIVVHHGHEVSVWQPDGTIKTIMKET